MTKGFLFKKIWYYLQSMWSMIISVKNPWVFFLILFKRESRLDFRRGFSLFMNQPLDVLIAKETICDDTYGLAKLKNPSYIIDVGAAMGEFAVMASHIYPRAKIRAFDPNPSSLHLLKQNIAFNHMKNIRAYDIAIGNKPFYTFYVEHANARSSTIKDGSIKDGSPDAEIKVKAEPLESYLTKDVDLLKIDTEGGEIDILESIKSWKRVKKVICEYHRHLVENQDKLISNELKKHFSHVEKLPDSFNDDIGYIVAY